MDKVEDISENISNKISEKIMNVNSIMEDSVSDMKKKIQIMLDICNEGEILYQRCMYLMRIPLVILSIGSGIINSIMENNENIRYLNVGINFLISILVGSDFHLKVESKMNNLRKNKIQLEKIIDFIENKHDLTVEKMKEIELLYNNICDTTIEPIPEYIKMKIRKIHNVTENLYLCPKILTKVQPLFSKYKTYKVGNRLKKRLENIENLQI